LIFGEGANCYRHTMEFVCPDPKARVRAANVRATIDAFKLMPELGRKIIAQHGLKLEDLGADRFIPVQRWLDALKDVQSTVGPDKVRSVGRNLIDHADFPPSLNDPEGILLTLDEIHGRNHRGDVGHYGSSRTADGTIVLRCETPYPPAFEWGLVDGICRNPRATGRYEIQYDPAAPGQTLTCTLRIRRL
jgi:hypothetical protein